ncbi:MAG: alpha/beta fold hydrolase [Phycisphaera sp.]|nr:alpha/beta fold hydrolase [Phycisphaera sp.]
MTTRPTTDTAPHAAIADDAIWRTIAADPIGVSIPQGFAAVVERYGDRPAIDTPTDRWDYATLDRLSRSIAACVLGREAAGAPVAIRFASGAPLIATMFGVLRSGRPYVVLNPADPLPRQRDIIANAGCTLMLCDAEPDAATRAVLGGTTWVTYAEATGAPSDTALPDVSPLAACSITYTSGTTGRPKGVVQSHRNVVHQVARYHAAAGLRAGDRVALVTPANYAAAVSPIFGALLTGATLCPFDLATPDAHAMARWVGEQRITVFQSVPTVFRALMREADDGLTLPALRVVRLGGDVVLKADLERFQTGPFAADCRLMVSLSSTETGLLMYGLFDRATVIDGATLPLTHEAPGVRVRVIDAAGNDAPDNEPGELVATSAYLSPGYWGEIDTLSLTASADTPPATTYHTGDLARRTTDGRVCFVGRADRRVKVHGNRFELEEVESAMLSLPDVAEAAVVAQQRFMRAPRVVGFVVPMPGRNLRIAQARSDLYARLPNYMVPTRIVRLAALPKLPNGKIDRGKLDVSCDDVSAADVEHLAPRAQFDGRMQRIWEQVLETAPIGLDDAFSDLGGDSLKEMSVLRRIEETYGVTLPPSALVESPTLRTMADHVARAMHETTGPTPLVTMRGPDPQDADAAPPVFFIHALEGGVSWARPLANRLPAGRPLYGLQSPATYGRFSPTRSIGRLAATYAPLLRSVTPDNRCAIVGYCLGGAVALELARELAEHGVTVDTVVLIDTPLTADSDSAWLSARRWIHKWRDAVRVVRWRAKLIAERVQRRGAALMYTHRFRLFVQQLHRWALARYTPRVPPAPVVVLKVEQARLRRGADAQDAFIAALDPPPRVVPIPGDHLTCLQPPHLDGLVDILCDLLNTPRPERADDTSDT